jgi:hypothetical protein
MSFNDGSQTGANAPEVLAGCPAIAPFHAGLRVRFRGGKVGGNSIRIRVQIWDGAGKLLASPMAKLGENPRVLVEGGALEITVPRRELAEPETMEAAVAAGALTVRFGKTVVQVDAARKNQAGDWVLAAVMAPATAGEGGGR